MSSRVGRIGAPSDWLVASMPDAAVVAEAWGPFVVDVPIAEVFEAMSHADSEETADTARDFVSSASGCRRAVAGGPRARGPGDGRAPGRDRPAPSWTPAP